jgi:hypothetical protein
MFIIFTLWDIIDQAVEKRGSFFYLKIINIFMLFCRFYATVFFFIILATLNNKEPLQ